MKYNTIYELIKGEEENFKLPIQVEDGWDWNFREHIRTTTFYKHSRYTTGTEDRPFKNIIRSLLNLQYRAEGFDLKDILIFVDEATQYFKSFLIRKFHDIWARKNKIDDFIDKLVESYVDYGGVLVKKGKEKVPEVVPWQSIAFADQTDFLSGPFGIKHQFSPEQLREIGKEHNWESENVEEVITLADYKKDSQGVGDNQNQTPGKNIEVYEVHGCFPAHWLEGEDGYRAGEYEEGEYFGQLHICTFYRKENGEKEGIWLFRGREDELPFKLLLRDAIFGRALGMGGAEELFEHQVWINYGVIRIRDLLDAASKIVFKTNDPAYHNRNKYIKNMDNLEITVLEDGKDLSQIDTTPRNLVLFERFVQDFEAGARTMSAATESILGEQPSSGTPFKLQELVTAESHSLHEYRKGKLARFVDEIYMDWIIPALADEITDGDEFLAELDMDEMRFVADQLADLQAQKAIKQSLMNGILLTNDAIEDLKANVKERFFEGGNKRFLKIMKEEFVDAPLRVKINIAGKQKDLAGKVDKLVNVFRFVFQSYNPQTGTFAALEDPNMAKIFSQIIEFSGLEPISFFRKPSVVQAQPKPPLEATRQLRELGESRSIAEQISNK